MSNPLFDQLFRPHAGHSTPFLHLPDGGVVSHAALLTRAAHFGQAMAGLGLVPGDRVAVQVEKSPDVLAVYAACVQAGLVFLPLNPAYTPAEVEHFIGDSQAALLVATPDKAAALAEIAARHGAQLQTLDRDGTGTLADLAEGQPDTLPTQPRAPDDLAAILYTSGTTGRPKGAMLTQTNLSSNAQVLVQTWRFDAADVLLHALPVFHTHGLFVATNVTLLAGGSMLFLPEFDVDAVIRSMPRATSMMGVPTYYTRLLTDPRLADVTAHMRLFISGSAPLQPDTHWTWTARTGHRILERYGMTETSMVTSNPLDADRRPGSVGLPLPSINVRICDEAGRVVPLGDVGVLEVRGPNVFAGYWRMPDKTAAEMRPDGFFITGDLARQDSDGYIRIVGRGRDLIISGGLNIYPSEVEAGLNALPGVAESAVFGVPHPDLGEAALAVIVPEPGTVPDPAALLAALAQSLTRFKLPRALLLHDALPRNAMGKLQKAELQAAHAGHFAAPAGRAGHN